VEGLVVRDWKLRADKLLLREQVTTLITFIKKHSERDYVLFAVAANTGLRISEVLHLRRDDLKGAQLIVTRRKKRVLSPESLPLAPALAELLAAWVKKGRGEWAFPGDSHGCVRLRRQSGAVVGRESLCAGGHLSKRHAQRIWESYIEKKRMASPGRGVHALRHYAITEFYRLHKDLRAAQVYAGHSSSTITERYAHVLDLAEQIQKVQPIL
jgi:integrase